jgi:tripartite-type tricarboxylate transporter receptor subunit TctC
MQAISAPATHRQLVDMGYEIVANTPEQFGIYLREQIAAWTKIVRDNAIHVE